MHQDKFKEITAAYQVIGDKEKKKQYDEIREEILTGKKKDSSSRSSSGSSSGGNWNYNYNQQYHNKSQYNSSGFQPNMDT